MSTRNFVNLNIAVVGSGKTAERLAIILAFADHNVFVGAKEENFAAAVNHFRFHENIFVTTVEDAAAQSEVVVIAASGNEVKEMAYLVDDVKSKVVIDYCSFTSRYAEPMDTLNAIEVITGSKQVVKCYSVNGYKKFISPMLGKEKIDICMVGDNKKSKVIAKIIFDDLGFAECRDYGSSEAINLLEVLTENEQKINTQQKELVHVAR